MKRLAIVLGLVFAVAGTATVWAEDKEKGDHRSVVFDQSGRVVRTGPGAYCDKTNFKICPFKSRGTRKDAQASGETGCCFHK